LPILIISQEAATTSGIAIQPMGLMRLPG